MGNYNSKKITIDNDLLYRKIDLSEYVRTKDLSDKYIKVTPLNANYMYNLISEPNKDEDGDEQVELKEVVILPDHKTNTSYVGYYFEGIATSDGRYDSNNIETYNKQRGLEYSNSINGSYLSVYEGTFKDNKKEGKGAYRAKLNNSSFDDPNYTNTEYINYKGEWINGEKRGLGIFKHVSIRKTPSSNNTYEKFYNGQFANNTFNGSGKLFIFQTDNMKTFKCNMDCFEGNFKDGEYVKPE